MKLITYSDLHLEFGHPYNDLNHEADIMILSGDVSTSNALSELIVFLQQWDKPVIYVMGNHEYYSINKDMDQVDEAYSCIEALPNVHILRDQPITIDGVNFFGGTMWTDINKGCPVSIEHVKPYLRDFSAISIDGQPLTPYDTINLHNSFKRRLLEWFEEDLKGPRVVITHHAPVFKKETRHKDSLIKYAFNCRDMEDIILEHTPDLWIYGHTHESDDQMLGSTRIISNQRGYTKWTGEIECNEFDKNGKLTEL